MHRSPLSSAASASSDDAARAPRTVAPYRPRPSSARGGPRSCSRVARRRASARALTSTSRALASRGIRDRAYGAWTRVRFGTPGSRREDTRGAPFEATRVRDRPEGSRGARRDTPTPTRPFACAHPYTRRRVRGDSGGNLVRRGRTRRGPGTGRGGDGDGDARDAIWVEKRRRAAARSTETKAALRRAPRAAAAEDESERSKPTTLSRASSVLRRFAAPSPSSASFSPRSPHSRRRRRGRVPRGARQWTRRLELTGAGGAHREFATPTFSRPGESNAARSGGIHHDRHAATAGPPPASTHTSSAPPRPRLLALARRAPPRVCSSCISRRRRAERAETSVAAAVHTESSRIAANVSESTSGRIAREVPRAQPRDERREGDVPTLTGRVLREETARRRPIRNAAPPRATRTAPVLASTISSNADCTSFTVCDGIFPVGPQDAQHRDVNSSDSTPAVASPVPPPTTRVPVPVRGRGKGASPGSPSAAAAARASAAARTRASAFKAADA